MGNYIKQTEYKKSVRCVQILAYFSLIGVLADIVFFVLYSLRPGGVKDSIVFFTTVVLAILGCALHSAVGISLPNNGKFNNYKIAIYTFIIADIIGFIHGLRTLTVDGPDAGEAVGMIFYTTFYFGCLLANILTLRAISGSIGRKAGTAATILLILLISLHLGDIVHSMIHLDTFENDIPSKKNLIRLISNIVFLVCSVQSMIVILIKPQEDKTE